MELGTLIFWAIMAAAGIWSVYTIISVIRKFPRRDRVYHMRSPRSPEYYGNPDGWDDMPMSFSADDKDPRAQAIFAAFDNPGGHVTYNAGEDHLKITNADGTVEEKKLDN